jgi:hypothetical protein
MQKIYGTSIKAVMMRYMGDMSKRLTATISGLSPSYFIENTDSPSPSPKFALHHLQYCNRSGICDPTTLIFHFSLQSRLICEINFLEMANNLDMNQSFMERHKSFVSTPQDQSLLPLFYRVYKSTVQRQVVDVRSLSSYAAYIVILDDERQVLLWVGIHCDDGDVDLLKDLAKDVMTRDYGEERVEEFPIIFEKFDASNPLLEPFLDILQSNATTYSSKQVQNDRRKNPIENSPISVGIVDPLLETFSSSMDNQDIMNNFELREISFAHPDAQSGMVPRVAFAPVEMNSIVYITIGDQWDLWIARGAEGDTVDAAIQYLETLIQAQLIESTSTDITEQMIRNYYQVTHQGEERVCFRRPLKIFTDFEPPGKTVPRPHTDAGPMHGINRRLLEQKQSSHMNSFFNEYRVETENPDDPEFDRKSTSMSRSMSTSNYGGFHGNSMVIGASNTEMKTVDFFVEVKPQANTVHNFAFNDKFPEEERKKLAALCAEMPQLVVIPFDDPKSINPGMVTMVDIYNIAVAERKEILERAAQDPETLLGWQVSSEIISSWNPLDCSFCLYAFVGCIG